MTIDKKFEKISGYEFAGLRKEGGFQWFCAIGETTYAFNSVEEAQAFAEKHNVWLHDLSW